MWFSGEFSLNTIAKYEFSLNVSESSQVWFSGEFSLNTVCVYSQVWVSLASIQYVCIAKFGFQMQVSQYLCLIKYGFWVRCSLVTVCECSHIWLSSEM